MHHISYFYEFSNTKLNPYLNYPEFPQKQKEFQIQDEEFIKESKKIFSVSKFVAQKLQKYNNLQTEVIYPFLEDIDKFYSDHQGNYFFLPSLITFTKRQHLILESPPYTKNPIKIISAGQAGKKYYQKYILSLLKNHK